MPERIDTKAVRHPDWPKGMTADEFLVAGGPWQDLDGLCRSCGRRAENPLNGHDGFCPVPFLAVAMKTLAQEIADHEADRKRLEALEDVRDADWRKFVHLRNDNERIRMLGEQLAAAEARNEALEGEAAGRALMDAEGEAFLPEVVKQLQSCIEALEKEVEVDEKLLAERDRLLDAIPACEAHGNQCVPHAIEWVLASVNLEKAADAILGWFTKGVNCSPPQNFIHNLRVARQVGPTWEEEHAARAFEAKRA